jgi:hypothetical protein
VTTGSDRSVRSPSITELLKENQELRLQVSRERQRATLSEHRAQLAEELSRHAWRVGAWQAPGRAQDRDHA